MTISTPLKAAISSRLFAFIGPVFRAFVNGSFCGRLAGREIDAATPLRLSENSLFCPLSGERDSLVKESCRDLVHLTERGDNARVGHRDWGQHGEEETA